MQHALVHMQHGLKKGACQACYRISVAAAAASCLLTNHTACTTHDLAWCHKTHSQCQGRQPTNKPGVHRPTKQNSPSACTGSMQHIRGASKLKAVALAAQLPQSSYRRYAVALRYNIQMYVWLAATTMPNKMHYFSRPERWRSGGSFVAVHMATLDAAKCTE
jgi:hypothetical protein